MAHSAVLVANRAFGISASRHLLIERLLQSGWNVYAAAAADGYQNELISIGAEFLPVPFAQGGPSLLKDGLALRVLVSIYKRLQPTLVHHFNFKPILYGGIAARMTRTATVVSTVTGTGYAFESRIGAPLAMSGYRIGLGVSEATVFQNPDDREFFESRCLVPRKRSHLIISSGVDSERYKPAATAPEYPTFLMVTRLLWKKGVHEYVEAAAQLKQMYPRVRFILGGEEMSDRSDAVPTAWLKDLPNRGIEYLGYVSDMPALLRSCTAFVFPSQYREGVPRVLLEAAASGLAVITTDSIGCKEAVRPGITGLLVEPGSVEDLTKAMESLIMNPVSASEMGRRGRAWMMSDFRQEDIIENTLTLYRELGLAV